MAVNAPLPAFGAAPIVLLVDADIDSLRMYEYVLSRAGFDVDTATDGIQAIERLSRRIPAAIALELSLGEGLDGYELCRHVRAHPETRAVHLVAVTAYAFTTDADRARAAGCEVVLTKPCLPETLLDVVGRLTGRQPVAARSTSAATATAPATAAAVIERQSGAGTAGAIFERIERTYGHCFPSQGAIPSEQRHAGRGHPAVSRAVAH